MLSFSITQRDAGSFVIFLPEQVLVSEGDASLQQLGGNTLNTLTIVFFKEEGLKTLTK